MSKKPRYFMVGGNEPEEEPSMVSQEQSNTPITVDDIIEQINKFSDDAIDEVIDMIIKKGIDPNYQKGINDFGKREYIRKLFELLNKPIVLPQEVQSLSGSGRRKGYEADIEEGRTRQADEAKPDETDEEKPDEKYKDEINDFITDIVNISYSIKDLVSNYDAYGKPQYRKKSTWNPFETNFKVIRSIEEDIDGVNGKIILAGVNHPSDEYDEKLQVVEDIFYNLVDKVDAFITKYSDESLKSFKYQLIKVLNKEKRLTKDEEEILDSISERLKLPGDEKTSVFKQPSTKTEPATKDTMKAIDDFLDTQKGVIKFLTDTYDLTPFDALELFAKNKKFKNIKQLLFLRKYDKALFTKTSNLTIETLSANVQEAKKILDVMVQARDQREESVKLLVGSGWPDAQEYALIYETLNEIIKKTVKILPKKYKIMTWVKVIQSQSYYERADIVDEGNIASEGKTMDLEKFKLDDEATWGAGFHPDKLENMYEMWSINNDMIFDFFWAIQDKVRATELIKKGSPSLKEYEVKKLVHSMPPSDFITVPFPNQFFEFFNNDAYIKSGKKDVTGSKLYKQFKGYVYDEDLNKKWVDEPILNIDGFIEWFKDNAHNTGGFPLFVKGTFKNGDAIIYNYKHPWCFKYNSDNVYFFNALDGTKAPESDIKRRPISFLKKFLTFATKNFGK